MLSHREIILRARTPKKIYLFSWHRYGCTDVMLFRRYARVVLHSVQKNEVDISLASRASQQSQLILFFVHTSRPNVCLECENTFSCRLTRHQKEKHRYPEAPRTKRRDSKVRHYSCGQRSADFYGYGAALTHLTQPHGKPSEGEAATATSKINHGSGFAKEKMLQCQQ